MNMLHFAFLVDDDPYRNGIESALNDDGIDSLYHVFATSVVFDAYRNVGLVRLARCARRPGQLNHIHAPDETFHQLCVAAGEYEFEHMAADLCCQNVPVQVGNRRTVVESDKGAIS